ncbi:MAG: hypothetical protein FVQ81_08575 [Candidatus Glassbacteria bacterium]|nr:hypothetical protein [Candidatus Glassbacteria bacterium]
MWDSLQRILLSAAGATLGQLFTLVAPLLLFGWLIHLVSNLLERSTVRLLGLQAYIYLIGWIGTMVHELGHAILCPVFGHKITGMRLFSFNTRNRDAGYVSHSYTRGNIWHLAGNFFISVGPLVLGSLVIFVLLRYLAGLTLSLQGVLAGGPNLDSGSGFVNWLTRFGTLLWDTTLKILRSIDWTGWRIYLAGWLVLAVGSGMTLSSQDLKAAASGLGVILLVLLTVNLIAALLGYSTPDYTGTIRLSVTACLLMTIVLVVCAAAAAVIRLTGAVFGR